MVQERNPELSSFIRQEMEQKGIKKIVHAGETRETRLPESGEKRSLAVRFERGQILRAYQIIREEIQRIRERGSDPSHEQDFLQKFREHARDVEKELDLLNQQYYKNGTAIEIETPEIGRHSIALAELDLKKPREGEQDPRIPYVVIGGIATNYHETAVLSLALALRGHRVFSLSYPEQKPSQFPSDWGGRLKRDGTFRPHAEVMRETIEKMGFDRVNIVGDSMGGSIAIEAATDKDFCERINDLIVLEPVGFEEKSLKRMGYDFLYRQGLLRTLSNAEERLKAFRQGAETTYLKSDIFLADANILRRKQFDAEKLARVQPQGRYQIWLGTESPVASEEKTREALLGAEEARTEQNPQRSPIEIYRVEGGDHAFPIVHAMGIARAIEKESPIRPVTTLSLTDLENSAAASIMEEKLR